MFMQNIPRRKIYETMLEYEDGLIEMQILFLNEINFANFKNKFNTETILKIRDKYKEIKCLFVMFLENKKHIDAEEFKNDLKYHLENEIEVKNIIKKDKNIPKRFYELCLELDNIFENTKSIDNIDEAKNIFEKLDEFNTIIPEMLVMRRDDMMRNKK